MKTYQFTVHLIGKGKNVREALFDAVQDFEFDFNDSTVYQPQEILKNADAKPVINYLNNRD